MCWTAWPICFRFRVVPTTSKNADTNNPAKTETDLPFEAALKRLQGVLEALESEDLPLESLLARYEEGTGLAKVCQQKLAEAELKIQRLEKNASGELRLKPVEAPAERSLA